MKTTAKFININSLEVELTMTMRLEEWRKIRDGLDKAWPSSKLREHIAEVITNLENVAYMREKE